MVGADHHAGQEIAATRPRPRTHRTVSRSHPQAPNRPKWPFRTRKPPRTTSAKSQENASQGTLPDPFEATARWHSLCRATTAPADFHCTRPLPRLRRSRPQERRETASLRPPVRTARTGSAGIRKAQRAEPRSISVTATPLDPNPATGKRTGSRMGRPFRRSRGSRSGSATLYGPPDKSREHLPEVEPLGLHGQRQQRGFGHPRRHIHLEHMWRPRRVDDQVHPGKVP